MLPGGIEPVIGSQARRQYARFSIGRETWTTETGSSILTALRDVGMGIRTQDFYAIRRDVLSIFEREDVFADVPLNQLLPVGRFYHDHGAELSLSTLYKFDVLAWNKETEEYEILPRALSTNWHLTKQEALDAAWNMWELKMDEGETPQYIMCDVAITDAWSMPGTYPTRGL